MFTRRFNPRFLPAALVTAILIAFLEVTFAAEDNRQSLSSAETNPTPATANAGKTPAPKVDSGREDRGAATAEAAVATLTPLLPTHASAKAAKARRLLVFSPAPGKSHSAVGDYGATAIRLMGQTSQIYRTTVTNNPAILDGAGLRPFDAVVLNNTFGDCFGDGPAGEKRALCLLEFVKNGKGLIGIHGAAVVPNYQQPPADRVESEYRLMLGGAFEKPVSMSASPDLQIEDPLNQICAAFQGQERYPMPFKDEIIQLKAPYSRDHLRVLVSADLGGALHQGTRPDHDYPVVWIKAYDQGRVFFFALGHGPDTFNDRVMLRVLQDGIQYALGDLPANDEPR
jgi:uncharacterized protein